MFTQKNGFEKIQLILLTDDHLTYIRPKRLPSVQIITVVLHICFVIEIALGKTIQDLPV